MKALLLYSHQSGHRNFSKKIPLIQKELADSFTELHIQCTFSEEEASRLEEEACGVYDALLIVGGDGTFNNAVNSLMKKEIHPILGYINVGTIGDVGRNFGVTSSIKKALRIIKEGHVEPLDVGECGGHYFAYCCAAGAYSDIAYQTKRKKKRIVGRFAYYSLALKEAFHPETLEYEIEANGEKYHGQTPFILLLNGRFMGGFLVNPRSKVNDGKMELFLVKPGLFNGLLHYLFHTGIKVIRSDLFKIEVSTQKAWCLDGEKGSSGSVSALLHPSALRVFSKKI
jgi:diacylglycerol kinase (ATP)